MGIADFIHERAADAVDLEATYLNAVTGGGPESARLPVVVPDDRVAFAFAYSTTGVRDPGDLRVAYVRNTLEPDGLLVSEPVAADLRGRPTVTVGEERPLALTGGDLAIDPPHDEDEG